MATPEEKTPGRQLYEQWCNAPGTDREHYWFSMNLRDKQAWETLAIRLGMQPHPMAPDRLVEYRVEKMADQPWPEIADDLLTREFATDADRDWSKFDLSNCRHLLSVGAEVAGWWYDICVACGAVTNGPACMHPAGSEWNEAGTLLRCKTCGVDGT